jgi:hypothetical protein
VKDISFCILFFLEKSMFRKIIIIILNLFYFSNLFCFDFHNQKPQSNIITLDEKIFYLSTDEPIATEKNMKIRNIYQFDPNNNVSFEMIILYSPKGSSGFIDKYEYSKDRIISIACFYTDGRQYQIKSYNYKNNILTEIKSENLLYNGFEETYYEYDDKNRIVSVSTYNDDGKLKNKYTLSYIADLILPYSKTEYRENNTISGKYVYSYNNNNDIVVTSFYFEERELYKNITTYTYDSRNNWMSSETIQQYQANDKIVTKPLEYKSRTFLYKQTTVDNTL